MQLLLVGFCVLALAGASAFAQTKPAYLIAEFTVTDPVALKARSEKVSAVGKPYGGAVLAVRAAPSAVVGDPPEYATIVRFESMDKARAYANAAEALASERDKSGKFRTYIVEGAASP